MKKTKLIYILLLVVVNAIGLLGIFYLTAIYNLVTFVEFVFSGIPGSVKNEDPHNVWVIYGGGVVVIISLISYLINLRFRKRLGFDGKKMIGIMLIQFASFVLASGLIIRFFYII